MLLCETRQRFVVAHDLLRRNGHVPHRCPESTGGRSVDLRPNEDEDLRSEGHDQRRRDDACLERKARGSPSEARRLHPRHRCPSARSRLQRANPSSRGMLTSVTTISIDASRRVSSAARPSTAHRTSWPASVSARDRTSRSARSSSTRSIRATGPRVPVLRT